MAEIWFWQRIVTPHMAGLACALARQGHLVTYVAEREMSEDRARQGWQAPDLPDVTLRFAGSAAAFGNLVAQAPASSIHICQGIRGNGSVSLAQRALKRRGLKQWVVMETVRDDGLSGHAKRMLYRLLFFRWRRHLQGVLATGWRTPDWVRARGMPAEKVFPFAYFLSDVPVLALPMVKSDGPFRVLFVGRFIECKRLDLLISVLGSLAKTKAIEFKLQAVGSGPLEQTLRAHGERVIGDRLQWLGRQPMNEVRALMASVDCLVLPSQYDGWGAVVSEALMAGTPVIASDACGSAGVVQASGRGGVFPANEADALKILIQNEMDSGPVLPDQRKRLAAWARCLGAEAGAAYLSQVIHHISGDQPLPPWSRAGGVFSP